MPRHKPLRHVLRFCLASVGDQRGALPLELRLRERFSGLQEGLEMVHDFQSGTRCGITGTTATASTLAILGNRTVALPFARDFTGSFCGL